MHPPPTDPLSISGAHRTVVPDRPGGLSVLGAVNAVLRQRWTVVASGVLFAAAVAAVTLLQPRTFTSSASFVPQAPQQAASGLSSVASQFGLNVGESGSTDSPAFYADLLTSRGILRAVADSPYTAPTGPPRQTSLAEILGIGATDTALRRHRTIERLQRQVSAGVAPKTGAVELSVTTRSATLSHEIVERLLGLVSEFNRERRQSRAVAERRFTEERLGEAQEALAIAERRLESFLTRNRQYRGSPTLEFEHDRLAREVSVRDQHFLMMSQAYERARIDEVRDTPVITTIESPEVPVLPNRRMLLVKGLVGLVAGALFGIVLALVRHALAATQRSRSDEYAEFVALRRETLADLKRPWRPLTRRPRGIAAS
jgi:uncharacterized protein involved in exopolysaccharide biosynthesis